ncbi:MAG: carbamoyl phosphate synthase small subunit [Clostridia bacterium]|nr:carbamoyl phosphate synthase small subunit [Clostridia bacterium]
MKKAYLALSDGTVFEGVSLGAAGRVVGEIVFTTGMVGYLEAITDPSFAGQIVTMTYPIIGNYGINRDDCQSKKAQVRGLIMKEAAEYPNNFRCKETLEDYLVSENVIAITGIDTRALTRILRTQGSMNGMIITEENFNFSDYEEEIKNYKVDALVDAVTCKESYTVGEGSLNVAVLDCGLKRTTVDSLTSRGAKVTVYPASTKAETILSGGYDGFVVSNGPGDPMAYPELLPEVKALLTSGKPFLGIGLGHQLAALSMGAKTEKLKFGHRGANQPVKDVVSGLTFVTGQNHGYAVLADSVDAAVAEISHINVNDQTVEGLRYKNLPALSVQYDPEFKPGPKSMKYLLDEFASMMGGKENA